MKTCKKCKVQKDPSEFSNDRAKKDGLQPKCKACNAEYCKANRESILAQKAEYRKANRESILAKQAEYYQENRESLAAKQAEWRQENRESIAAYNAEYGKANPDKSRARMAKRRAAKLQRTPSWVDFEAIKAIYAEAHRLEELDGITRHVDHIIPLQGELASGLHIANNLQILTAEENLSKSNKFVPH